MRNNELELQKRAVVRTREWRARNPEKREKWYSEFMSQPNRIAENRRRATKWYHQHKEQVRERNKVKRDHIHKVSKLWREANRTKILEMQKRWREKNKPHRDRYIRAYCRSTHGKLVYINAAARRKARLLGAVATATTHQISCILRASKTCYYCSKTFSNSLRKTIDHIMPLSLGGHHSIENMAVCCKSCNSIKKDKHPSLFAIQIGRLLI